MVSNNIFRPYCLVVFQDKGPIGEVVAAFLISTKDPWHPLLWSLELSCGLIHGRTKTGRAGILTYTQAKKVSYSAF